MTPGLLLLACLAAGPPARLATLGARFTEPQNDPAWVMPVGTGELVAMARYGDAWELHLSRPDYFGIGAETGHSHVNIHALGHLQVDFGIARGSIKLCEQRLDLARGSVVLSLKTDDGPLTAEVFGVMGRHTLIIAVDDGRRARTAKATLSCWRPTVTYVPADGRLVSREVHDYQVNGKPPAPGAKVDPSDRMYHLGCSAALAFAGERGPLPTTGADGVLTATGLPAKYWLVLAGATSYDTRPEAAAGQLLDAAVSADKAALLAEHLGWWRRFWDAAWLDLRGPDADTLMRAWYTGWYSYASVAGGPVMPKFNGGPGTVQRDDRSWGIGCWWQNTRELIWPLCAGNHPEYARSALDFYDRTFNDNLAWTAKQHKLGLRMFEWVAPFKPGLPPPVKQVSKWDPAALATAMADTTAENAKSGYNVRSLAQSTELLLLMADYVAYTGDADYWKTLVPPWLHEVALFYLSWLRLGEDGLYHSMVGDAAENWWRIKDCSIDLSAARHLFALAVNWGAEFGYEPEFIAACRERLDKLPPLPTGAWAIGKNGVTIDRAADVYAPGADLYDDRVPHNTENPELYIVYPFAMVDGQSPAAELQRAVNTFRKRRCPNHAGWSQCPVQAARLRLDDTAAVILDHLKRHMKFPYGGWNSPAGQMKESKLGVVDTPFFDSNGVCLTAVQEMLLQSHRLWSPAKVDPLSGGPLVLAPAVPQDWSGSFKLAARGGFVVTAEFAAGRRPVRATIDCPRGGRLAVVNPGGECRVNGKTTTDKLLALDTRPGEVVELSWAETDARLNPPDIAWGFHAAANADPKLPRVLLIGDSIVGGYREQVAQALAGKATVDAWVTGLHEAAPDLHPYLRKALAHGPYAVVHFNIGLHGWPKGRIPDGQYEPLMRQYVDIVKAGAPGAKLVWASSTPVTTKGSPDKLDPDINPTIVERNGLAARIMADHGIPIDDLYGLMVDKLATCKSANKNDQFHWGPAGVKVQAEAVTACLLRFLQP